MSSDAHPFLSHLVVLLSVYEQGPTPMPTPLPRYDGPRDWQTDAIERSIASIARRMHTAEDAASRTDENDTASDVDAPTNPTALLAPNSDNPSPALEPETTAVEELRLLKMQVSDVARVCQWCGGDLSQKVTIPMQDGVMVQLKDNINTMVNTLGQFATEVTRVTREVGTEGILGGQADIGGAQGMWKDITLSVNEMVRNLTTQLRGVASISTAAVDGDFTRFLTVEASGEMEELKRQINMIVYSLREAIQKNTAPREALVGQEI